MSEAAPSVSAEERSTTAAAAHLVPPWLQQFVRPIQRTAALREVVRRYASQTCADRAADERQTPEQRAYWAGMARLEQDKDAIQQRILASGVQPDTHEYYRQMHHAVQEYYPASVRRALGLE